MFCPYAAVLRWPQENKTHVLHAERKELNDEEQNQNIRHTLRIQASGKH
jgi:hypothetical protein